MELVARHKPTTMSSGEIKFPWDDSPEFCRVMESMERGQLLGPCMTLYRRHLMWKLWNSTPLWTIPDDPLNLEDWT